MASLCCDIAGLFGGSLTSAIDLNQTPVVANLAWAGQIDPSVFGESLLYLNRILIRALGVEVESNLRETGFEDVNPNSGLAPYIAKIAELGIIPPRSSIDFDPGGPVTRADMAWFLVRAIKSMDPVAEPADLFEDVEDPDLKPAVEALYAAGVTRGCGAEPLIYCPDQPVSRAQMASFLVRAFDLAS